jgi:hypothetical protein
MRASTCPRSKGSAPITRGATSSCIAPRPVKRASGLGPHSPTPVSPSSVCSRITVRTRSGKLTPMAWTIGASNGIPTSNDSNLVIRTAGPPSGHAGPGPRPGRQVRP